MIFERKYLSRTFLAIPRKHRIPTDVTMPLFQVKEIGTLLLIQRMIMYSSAILFNQSKCNMFRSALLLLLLTNILCLINIHHGQMHATNFGNQRWALLILLPLDGNRSKRLKACCTARHMDANGSPVGVGMGAEETNDTF